HDWVMAMAANACRNAIYDSCQQHERGLTAIATHSYNPPLFLRDFSQSPNAFDFNILRRAGNTPFAPQTLTTFHFGKDANLIGSQPNSTTERHHRARRERCAPIARGAVLQSAICIVQFAICILPAHAQPDSAPAYLPPINAPAVQPAQFVTPSQPRTVPPPAMPQ